MIGGSIIMKIVKWTLKDQSLFMLRLGELLENGYTLSDAIEFIKSQEKEGRRETLEAGLNFLKAGNSLQEMLVEVGFHNKMVDYIYYAEHYGDLSFALKEGGSFWKKRIDDLERLKKVFMYPLFMLLFISLLFIFLQNILLPKFMELIQNFQVEQTSFVFHFLLFLKFLSYFPYVAALLCIAGVTIYFLWFTKLDPITKKRLLLKIPLFGPLLKILDTYFFTCQLSSLLSGGLSINDSISLFSSHNRQPFYQEICRHIFGKLTEGLALEDIFKDFPFFVDNLSVVIASGQKHGSLDRELYHYSRFLLQNLEEQISSYIKIVQPVMFGIIGLMVISIYLAVLLPMFSIMDNI
jgi:competence protein ComGB